MFFKLSFFVRPLESETNSFCSCSITMISQIRDQKSLKSVGWEHRSGTLRVSPRGTDRLQSTRSFQGRLRGGRRGGPSCWRCWAFALHSSGSPLQDEHCSLGDAASAPPARNPRLRPPPREGTHCSGGYIQGAPHNQQARN